MNVSEAVLHELVGLGVEACFGNPGTSEMHLVASFDRVGGLRPILGLFEGVCTGAADGYARMAGKPAATLLHLGPGLGNGFANTHNAKRGQSRMINLVGDHATYHRKYDAPLQSDIHSIAKPISDWIGDPVSGPDAVAKTRQAFDVAMRPNGGLSTLIVPADIAWSEMTAGPKSAPWKRPPAKPVDMAAVREAAAALRSSEPRMLLIGGHAGLERPLALAAAIAEKTGAKLFADTFVPRLARGRGRARPDRVPYLGEMAVMMMQGYRQAVMVGTKAPVAFFAYPGKPSTFLSPECKTYQPWDTENDVMDVLTALAEEVGAKVGPIADGGSTPEVPSSGPLNVQTFGDAFAALLPEGAIVSDEAITSGTWAQIASQNSAPHDWLALTGGAIGDGIPMAVGAAVACPNRPVINIQADGSSMYTFQGLWTAARENLHVITILFNNKSYGILNMELDRVGATAQSERSRSLLSLDKPVIDFTALGRAMGASAVRVEDAAGFVNAFKRALAEKGRPHLIEAIMA
ncbi:MAG: acetolactate synthase large subunit [Alphaproteobacteria bacterium]|nr:acetolactate synthase large subunit [Alphaproteobacteria bacterium]